MSSKSFTTTHASIRNVASSSRVHSNGCLNVIKLADVECDQRLRRRYFAKVEGLAQHVKGLNLIPACEVLPNGVSVSGGTKQTGFMEYLQINAI